MVKINRSKYRCSECGKEYNYNNSLKKHLKTHQIKEKIELHDFDVKDQVLDNLERTADNNNDSLGKAFNLNLFGEEHYGSKDGFVNRETSKIEEEDEFNYENYYMNQSTEKKEESNSESEKKTLKIYHQGHFHILEDCKLKHLDENGNLIF